MFSLLCFLPLVSCRNDSNRATDLQNYMKDPYESSHLQDGTNDTTQFPELQNHADGAQPLNIQNNVNYLQLQALLTILLALNPQFKVIDHQQDWTDCDSLIPEYIAFFSTEDPYVLGTVYNDDIGILSNNALQTSTATITRFTHSVAAGHVAMSKQMQETLNVGVGSTVSLTVLEQSEIPNCDSLILTRYSLKRNEKKSDIDANVLLKSAKRIGYVHRPIHLNDFFVTKNCRYSVSFLQSGDWNAPQDYCLVTENTEVQVIHEVAPQETRSSPASHPVAGALFNPACDADANVEGITFDISPVWENA